LDLRGKHREWLTRLVRHDTRKLTAKDLTSNSLLEELVTERRNFIDEIGNEAMFAIEC
jgi:hypothetical protein